MLRLPASAARARRPLTAALTTAAVLLAAACNMIGIETLHVPVALGGVAIAILVATPEAVGAVRACASDGGWASPADASDAPMSSSKVLSTIIS